jgi:hypothetical protein
MQIQIIEDQDGEVQQELLEAEEATTTMVLVVPEAGITVEGEAEEELIF